MSSAALTPSAAGRPAVNPWFVAAAVVVPTFMGGRGGQTGECAVVSRGSSVGAIPTRQLLSGRAG
jgi:hypothetical protein